MADDREEARFRFIGELGHLARPHRLRVLGHGEVTCRCELGRARVDAPLERGVGILKPRGHAVELIAEHFELIARLDLDALVEMADADALGAASQRLDRNGHVPAQKEGGGDGATEKADEEKRRTLDRGADRGVTLLDRKLDEDMPAERGHERMRRKHGMA